MVRRDQPRGLRFEGRMRAEPFDKLRTALFDKLRTALVEASFDRLRAQSCERAPGCSADCDIGIHLKAYDGVPARRLGPPIGCPRFDIEGAHQLGLIHGPVRHGI
jgi:hypothetical protein